MLDCLLPSEPASSFSVVLYYLEASAPSLPPQFPALPCATFSEPHNLIPPYMGFRLFDLPPV